MKLKFLIASLTGCSGCISTLISLDLFPQFLERTKLTYFPFLLDVDTIEEADVALIEGCVSEESQIELLKKIRKNSKEVFALGSCAAFGGILSLSSKKFAEPISNYIEIDGIIPGCPPPSNLLGNCLIKLIENKELVLSNKNMCIMCPLRGELEMKSSIEITKLYPEPDEISLPEENSECFLKRGILCMGPIIRDGCEHKCIKQGIPCEGCLGPVSKDYTSNVVNFLSLIEISKNLKNYIGIFYRFFKPKFKEE